MTKMMRIIVSTSMIILIAMACLTAADETTTYNYEEFLNEFDRLLCKRQNQFTDKQLENVKTNCDPDTDDKYFEPYIKCSGSKLLTNREKLSAICNDTVSECATKLMEKTPALVGVTTQSPANTKKENDEFLACVKKYIGDN